MSVTEIRNAVDTVNSDKALVNEEANYTSVTDQIKEGEASIADSQAAIEQHREHIAQTRADVRRLKARRRVFARAKFQLEEINREFDE